MILQILNIRVIHVIRGQKYGSQTTDGADDTDDTDDTDAARSETHLSEQALSYGKVSMMMANPRFLLIIVVVMIFQGPGDTEAQGVSPTAPASVDVGSEPRDLVGLGNLCLFSADDGIHGRELWKSDGTTHGTVMVRDIHPGSSIRSSYGEPMVRLSGHICFSADDGIHGWELWKSDGTTSGTVLVRDLVPGPASPSEIMLIPTEDRRRVFFFTRGEVGDEYALWISDGTSSGTRKLNSIGNRMAYVSNTTILNRKLVFVTDGDNEGFKLWASDGTTSGTVILNPHLPAVEGDNVIHFVKIGKRIIFRAQDERHGKEPWVTDGTLSGTKLLKDIRPGPDGSVDIYYFTSAFKVGKTVYFSADDGRGSKLWQSDGSVAGTRPAARNIDRGISLFQSCVMNGTLYAKTSRYDSTDSSHWRQLWKVKSLGNRQLLMEIPHEIHPNEDFSWGDPLMFVGKVLFFTNFGKNYGLELWKSDGTPQGTRLVRALLTGPQPSTDVWMVHYLTDVNGRLIFSADDGWHGYELWVSDGTRAGTRMVKNIMQKPRDASTFKPLWGF